MTTAAESGAADIRAAAIRPEPDAFSWYCQMDKAATVMTLEAGLITAPVAAHVAGGIRSVIAAGSAPGADRPTDYLGVQAMLLGACGPDASRIHVGRSRQDMLATLHRLRLRARFIGLFAHLLDLRGALLALGRREATSLVPAYTNGVQAQPVTLGHLMAGYEAALGRAADRMMGSYARLNLSPLGAAVLAGSSFAVDRPRLAELLGFDGCVENAFDAAQLAVADVGIEAAQIAALTAVSVGTMIQDLHAQFHHARPWLLLADAGLLSPSTMMPQKSNPVALNRARLLASEVVGASVTATLAAHNVCSGLTDYKREDAADCLGLAIRLLGETTRIVEALRLDPAAARDEIEAEFTTTSELANVLQRVADVPFHEGHRLAAALVARARATGRSLARIPYGEIVALHDAQAGGAGPFPLDEATMRRALDPVAMVEGYSGLGGSSPAEVARILTGAGARLDRDRRWLAGCRDRLDRAEGVLETAFAAIPACVSPASPVRQDQP